MKYLKAFDWKPSRRNITDSLLILLAGLIIRTDPDNVILSLIAWASFIYAYQFLDEQWNNLRKWGPMIISLTYNALFHWYIL